MKGRRGRRAVAHYRVLISMVRVERENTQDIMSAFLPGFTELGDAVTFYHAIVDNAQALQTRLREKGWPKR